MKQQFRQLEEALRNSSVEAKVSRRGRVGIDRWYPYYAGFSRSFAEAALCDAKLPKGAVVLDPWNGGGTTTFVAHRLGHQAIGVDINPVATLIAAAKLARSDDASHVIGLVERISLRALSATQDGEMSVKGDPLSYWLPRKAATFVRLCIEEVVDNLARTLNAGAARLIDGACPPLAAFVVLALVRAAKQHAGLKVATNPTWIMQSRNQRVAPAAISQAWLKLIDEMAGDLRSETDRSISEGRAMLGDSKLIPLPDESCDLIITSPPYCTRIDYAISTSFELAALGVHRNSQAFMELRRRFMGAPIVRSQSTNAETSEWPSSITQLLLRIKNHKSKASGGYYFKTFHHYFSDATTSIAEIRRVLKVGRPAVLVVQTSNYKEIEVNLPELYMDIARHQGMATKMLGVMPVKRYLAQINTRSRQYAQEGACREAVICLEKM